MKISTRLSLAGLFSVGVVAVIGTVMLSATQQMRQELIKNETAGEILNAVTAVRYLTLEYVLRHEDRVRTQWQLKHASLLKLLTRTGEFTGVQEQVVMDRLRHTHESVGTLFPQLITSHQERQSDTGKGAVLEELESRLIGQITNKTQAMIADALSLSHQSRTGVLEAHHRASGAVTAFGGIVVLVIVSTLFLTIRSVTRPLVKLREGTAIVGAGNLDFRLGVTTRDEIGELARAFDHMTEKLQTTTLSRDELVEGSRVLAASAEEILASTTQIAAGSAQTATAVSQTTSTVEEVKRTAQVAAEKARHVSDQAQKTAQISQSGHKSVQESIEAMQRIQDQMGAIAESIVQLSEQNQAIGEIIATVSDLAEQSNLLAVNAAIEAAKAGEQGKGFAVVAQEVKSLAEQSKQATAQVRAILGDIQKATSAAVLATEQWGKAVEAGVQLSGEVGETIGVLASSIEEAARAATQIAVSAQQQLVGMDQVALAMENIKQTSTQNMESAKQNESIARNLHELGVKLQQLTAQYRA
jgi:methyl-accepting chemotaxis protein